MRCGCIAPARTRRSRRGRGVAAGLLATALAAAAAVPAQAAAPPVVALSQISDGRTFSSWAYPQSEALVRAHPAGGARAVGRLGFLTAEDQAQIYVVLAQAQLLSGAEWSRIELPGRPNGRTGWVPSGALGPLHTVHAYLLVDQHTLRLTLFRKGRPVFSAPVGVGAPGTVTPAGSFYVTEKLRPIGAPAYGPFALGTSAYAPTLSEWPGGGIVGIHGTDAPQLIPGRPSHGCVRMRDQDIARLWGLVEVGMPVDIT